LIDVYGYIVNIAMKNIRKTALDSELMERSPGVKVEGKVEGFLLLCILVDNNKSQPGIARGPNI